MDHRCPYCRGRLAEHAPTLAGRRSDGREVWAFVRHGEVAVCFLSTPPELPPSGEHGD